MAKATKITYDQVNWIAVGALIANPHHRRPYRGHVIVDGKPFWPKALTHNAKGKLLEPQPMIHTKSKDGHTVKSPIAVWRGLDKRVGAHYSGEILRAIRAIKGVGRPHVSILRSA